MSADTLHETLERIAKARGFGDLVERRSDREDFREVAVWVLEAMLRDAHAAGMKAAYEEIARAMPDETLPA